MTLFYFIFNYFILFAGNMYNCNACTKRLFETFLQRPVKLLECRRKIWLDFFLFLYPLFYLHKSVKANPQKLTQLSSRSHPRHLVGKRTAQKDITIDTTSDSQVNSNFPNRGSPASLTFNNYFYLFLYLYITWITTNNNAPHLKSPKNQTRRAALGRPAIKIIFIYYSL